MLRVPGQCSEKEKSEVSFRELSSWVVARVWVFTYMACIRLEVSSCTEIALELLTENFLNYYIKKYNEILAFQYLIPVGELVSFSYVVCCM